MKNKMVRGLVVAGMVSMMLTACGSKEQADVVQTTDMPAVQETDADVNTSIAEEDAPKAEAVTLTEEDMVVVPIDDTTAKLQSYSGEAESIIIPEEINGRKITVIGEEAFVNEEQLKSIVIPDTVTEIQSFVFVNSNNLECVVMSKNIEKIGERAFMGTSCYEIELPDTLKELGDGAFSTCKLNEVVIPGSIKVIRKGSFFSSKQLQKVVIEEGVEVIEKEAFEQCGMLESVTIPTSVTEITKPFHNSDNVTIYTPAGSYAETWAAENGVPCVAQ